MPRPHQFGKYQLLERIAVGGMAEVFVAKAFGVEGFERLLAIKKILPTMGEDAEFISMFVDEARIAVQLAHANIVQVLELGKHDDNLYIAMEYISGRDLRQIQERLRKQERKLPVAQACLIVAKVCEALDYAHRKRDARGVPLGIVHRDVSPQNVLVGFEGEVKLIDFGIAKAESRLQKTKTQAGILKGKFAYMSPEQIRGLDVDGRSDIFACGILFWELLAGEKLFTGESDVAILEKIRAGKVPRQTRPLPAGLERVIDKALHTEAAQRYQTASDLHDDLCRFALAGDVPMHARHLAQWMRDEFRADHEKEQARMRGWLQGPQDPSPARVVQLQSVLEAKQEIRPPDVAELDLSGESTAPRPRPARPGGRRLLLAVPALLVALVAIALVALPGEDLRPGKVIVTPSPAVAGDLYIDGRTSGPVPPFVHSVAPGEHRLEVRAEGYKPFVTTVRVRPGRPLEVTARLQSDKLPLDRDLEPKLSRPGP